MANDWIDPITGAPVIFEAEKQRIARDKVALEARGLVRNPRD